MTSKLTQEKIFKLNFKITLEYINIKYKGNYNNVLKPNQIYVYVILITKKIHPSSNF